ncbi:alpha/beta hydrolase [Dyella halodurans]|uniref:Alpha/beta hydrolase n=1 Tax=Dyella halodurans TaxID=1920171 RepID=A0ABV9C045_9GAMM|nr:alpha/beta hydrolase [Dyella halodurans]
MAAKGGEPIYKLPVPQAREVLEGAQSGNVPKLPVDKQDLTFNDASAGPVSITIIRPKGVTGTLPVVLYIHGAGWVLGSENTHDRLVRQLANGARAAVVFVNYSRAPESKFPVQNEQSYAAARWVVEHGKQHGIDGQNMAIAGDSVGGNMSAAVTLMAKELAGPKFVYQVLFYPVTDANFKNGSYREFANGPWLTLPAMQWFWNAYVPDEAARMNPLVTPLNATFEQLKGLPPALVITGENDVLRDEGEAYAHRLIAAGVDVTATRYLGTIHDFVMLDALGDTPAAKAAVAQANEKLHAALYPRS